jgi:hypothetical protein
MIERVKKIKGVSSPCLEGRGLHAVVLFLMLTNNRFCVSVNIQDVSARYSATLFNQPQQQGANNTHVFLLL